MPLLDLSRRTFLHTLGWSAATAMTASSLLANAPGNAPSTQCDWPQWRGPNHSGVTPEPSGWPNGWPPKKLWSRNVGLGCASPVIANNRLFVMGWQGKKEKSNIKGKDALFCLDAVTGKEIWKQVFTSRFQGRLRAGDIAAYGGPSSTPTFDPDTELVYTLSVDGDLHCRDTNAGGGLVWGKNLYEAFKIKARPLANPRGNTPRDYGYTSSPLLLGEELIVETGDEQHLVVALDKKTGEQKWGSQAVGPAGHSGAPVVCRVEGHPCLVVFTLSGLVVMRLDKGNEGKTVATYPWVTDFHCNIPTPAVDGNRILVTSNYNHNESHLVEIAGGAARCVWQSRVFAKVSSPLIHKRQAFVVDGTLKCMDLETGKEKWRGGNFGYGSCLLAEPDNKLIVFGSGNLALVEAEPKDGQYQELARVKNIIGGICYPHVALSRGIIACKDSDGEMACFSVRS